MFSTYGIGTLATTAHTGTHDPVPVSYVLVDGVPYVRTPHRSQVLAHISYDPRVSLRMGPNETSHDHRSVLIRGDAEVSDGFERAARFVAGFDQRFCDLLPPPLPSGATEVDECTAILRVSPNPDAND
ncbi:MAG: pyridoxamine 5'-phosphate oxidase family protein [Actinomycetia bacterium]|nr:pyridoxamine 5'-phosphate oxidase family protein [Actinomycetes bacterium]